MRLFGDLPPGFSSHSSGAATLIAATGRLASLVERGLGQPEAWTSGAVPGPPGAGRGGVSRVTLEDGSHAVIKQMRRGGLLGPLWRDRFRPGRRLADNLRIPLEALRRGIPTARPVALLVLRGTAGLCRAWLAMEEIAEARDLIRRIAGSDAPTLREIDAVMRLVRTMHERGIDHRDLNLGNLLLTDRGAAPPGVFVIDLDRARLRPGPIEPAARMRALRRLERSAVKLFGETPIETFDLRRVLYESYAAGEPRWSRLGERARSANRRWIRLHRLGWALGGRPKP